MHLVFRKFDELDDRNIIDRQGHFHAKKKIIKDEIDDIYDIDHVSLYPRIAFTLYALTPDGKADTSKPRGFAVWEWEEAPAKKVKTK